VSPALTTKQKLFITRMTENPEQAKWGFEILLKQPNLTEYFDHLKDAGLFAPEHNLDPIQSEDSRFVRIPYWSALDYLAAVAKQAGVNKDSPLAQKIMDVIRTVSSFRGSEGRSRDNYHTYMKFAEIIGLLPTTSITEEDLSLIAIWLSSKYDRGLVGHFLDIGTLKQLLASAAPDDWKKAVIILDHCTARDEITFSE
jgi:hypothetical protein